MAFCPKCGTTIPEGSTEKFCSTCGQPIEGNDAPETKKESSINTDEMLEKGKEVAGEALEKGKELVGNVAEAAKNIDVNDVVEKVKSGDKKTIGIVAGAIAVVVVVVLLIGSLFGGGYMDPINNYMKAMNRQETDIYKISETTNGSKITKLSKEYMKMMIEVDDGWYSSEYDDIDDFIEERAEDLEDYYDRVLDEYDDFKISFEKKDAEKMDKDDLEDLQEELNEAYEDTLEDYQDLLEDEDDLEDYADMMDMDEEDAKKLIKNRIEYCKYFAEGKVTDGYEIKGKFIVKADGDDYESDTVKLFVVKINGEWVYLGSEDGIYFEDDDEGVLRYLFYNFDGLY